MLVKKELPVCSMAMESWVVYATNVCRGDGDVLLGTNTLEDELHTGGSFATQNQTCTQYYHHIWSSSPNFWSVYVLFIKIFGSKIRTLYFLLIIFIEVEKKIRSRLTGIPWSFPGKLIWISTKPWPPQNYYLFWIDHLVVKSSFILSV